MIFMNYDHNVYIVCGNKLEHRTEFSRHPISQDSICQLFSFLGQHSCFMKLLKASNTLPFQMKLRVLAFTSIIQLYDQ